GESRTKSPHQKVRGPLPASTERGPGRPLRGHRVSPSGGFAMKNVWFRESEGNWYVTLRENGRRRQVLLVKAPNTRDGKKLAENRLLEELSARKYQEDGSATHSWILVSHVIDGFLKHSQEQHDPATYDWYK